MLGRYSTRIRKWKLLILLQVVAQYQRATSLTMAGTGPTQPLPRLPELPATLKNGSQDMKTCGRTSTPHLKRKEALDGTNLQAGSLLGSGSNGHRFLETSAGKKSLALYCGKRGPKRRMSISEIVTLNLVRILDRTADLKTFHRNACSSYISYFPSLTNL